MPVTSTPDHLSPYRRLVELGETECALLQAGHLDEVEALQLEWTQAMADLPSTPPADAADLLRRLVALSAQSRTDLARAMADLGREMGEAGRTRAVGRAYGGSASAGTYGAMATSTIDTAA